MSRRKFNVLFLCKGNSARSIMAEAILNRLGGDKFRAYSAGSHATGEIVPEIRDLLARLHYDVNAMRSKSWDEFAAADAPVMDFVFTLCDETAQEQCPVWPGQPMCAHWGVTDPRAIAAQGAERGLKLAEIYKMLDRRIDIFVNLRMDALDQLALKQRLDEIGRS